MHSRKVVTVSAISGFAREERFWNSDVIENLPGVLEVIAAKASVSVLKLVESYESIVISRKVA